ncbi:MAG: MDR family oxidoreductase [Candidatus Velthaea sp.]
MERQYTALVADTATGGAPKLAYTTLDARPPEAGEVVVRVDASALNYKDGLALTGRGKILRKSPMVPGVEFAGTIVQSSDPAWPPGKDVFAIGWGIGERFDGGYARYAYAKTEWLEARSTGHSAEDAMAFGIPGVTAMWSIMRLRANGLKDGGTVLVTGAGGGVGSVAILLLAHFGYQPVALSGRPELDSYFTSLGATATVSRETLLAATKPLEKETWDGAIDNVGGDVLAKLLPQMKYGASVALVGNAAGANFSSTVFPFILRAVNLLGIDSVALPMTTRAKIWSEAARLPREKLQAIVETVALADVQEAAARIIDGKTRGRVVVRVS